MILLWLKTVAGQATMAVVVFGMAFGWLKVRDHRNYEKGAESVRVETRKANDAAVKTSERVRAKSGSNGMRGTRDPNSID